MSNRIVNSPIERFTRILFSKVIERLAVVVSEEHLSFSQVAALHIIDREGIVNVNDISTSLNLSMSATSRMIDELVKKDLIERKEDQDNRRAKILSLTSSGKKFMDTLSIERVKIIEESAQALTDKVPLKILKIVSSKIFKDNSETKK
ncbi:MAG: MarR family transcriptional regulator [Bdellovibrio sp.]|nr:MarR family transcriptional regulator [Bdellovibrio sp.]